MPELPEVETVVRGLGKLLPGQTIKDIKVLESRSFLWNPKIKPKEIFGLKILSLARRGKGIIINLTKGYTLLIHLKMTGQLIYMARGSKARLNYGHPDANFLASMPSKHTRVYLTLSKGILYFNDQRLFGWVKATRQDLLESDPFIKKLGPEPFSAEFTEKYLATLIKRRPKSNIKAILLDQSGVVGIGNIYADEVLFDAKIRPTRLGKTITPKDVKQLFVSIQKILKLGIKYSGTSINTYKTPGGAQGKMQNYLMAYEQDKKPCKVCGNPIKKIRVAGRGTHYCPVCQK